jgi:hypothetical protein
MPKNPISDKDLLKKDDYKSIMYLIENYQYKDFKKNGLTAGHLLYALRKKNKKFEFDPEIEKMFTSYKPYSKKNVTLSDISSDKKINGHHIFDKKIIRGCIKNSVQLNERLKVLKKRGWIETVKNTKPRYYRYITTKKWMVDKPRRLLKDDIDLWKPNTIHEKMVFNFLYKDKKDFDNDNDKMIYNFILCGLSDKFLLKLNDKEKKQLNSWIKQASKLLYKIIELKYEKMKISFEDFVKMKYEDISRLNSIGFYYTATKNMVDLETVKK